MNRRHFLILLTALVLGLLLAGTAYSAYGLYRTQMLNERIRAGEVEAVPDGVAPELLFARARALRKDGELEQAIRTYERLLPMAGPELATAAQYNLGNLFFLRAALAVDAVRLREVLPLVMQARAHYQRTLFLDSTHFDAKYNLEYVERLVEERILIDEKESIDVSANRSRDGTYQWVTVHELPDGLP